MDSFPFGVLQPYDVGLKVECCTRRAYGIWQPLISADIAVLSVLIHNAVVPRSVLSARVIDCCARVICGYVGMDGVASG